MHHLWYVWGLVMLDLEDLSDGRVGKAVGHGDGEVRADDRDADRLVFGISTASAVEEEVVGIPHQELLELSQCVVGPYGVGEVVRLDEWTEMLGIRGLNQHRS